jgi:nucleoside-diphosphate-sugar epimerase
MQSDIVAVTGATGFIGQYIVSALKKKGKKVLEISRKSGFDIRSFESLDKIPRFDILIHLASKTYVPDSFNDNLSFYKTNVTGTLNCLELCKKHKAKIIFASTYVYGTPRYLPVDEDHPVSLWNPYATSKIIGEQLCAAYSKDFVVDACILRLFNLFGPGQESRFLIPTIIQGLKHGELILQNSSPKRDFVYIPDAVDAIEFCADSGFKGMHVYNVGYGVSYSVSEVVALIRDIMKSNAIVKYRDIQRQNEIFNVVADASRIKKELGWSPKFDLKTGLQHYINTLAIS